MPYYAQLSEGGVVAAVVQTAGPLATGPQCIEVDGFRPELAGALWDAGAGSFKPVPQYAPQQITRAQGKAILIMRGLWPAVLAYVDSIADPTEKALANVALHDTLNWERTSPTVVAAAAALGMTSEQLDLLFMDAAKVVL